MSRMHRNAYLEPAWTGVSRCPQSGKARRIVLDPLSGI